MGDNSRYGEFSQRRTPPVMRGRKVPGSEEDDGKFWKCRCGFINNIRLRRESDRVSFSGSEANVYDSVVLSGQDDAQSLDTGTSGIVNNEGKYQFEYHALGMDYHVGCAFCGRARYR
jgi:hypothetical protein